MHSIFLTEFFDWKQKEPSRKVCFINKILEKCGCWTRLSPPVYTGRMTNVEQRINMFHFVSQVLAYNVPGDLVELGCHNGQSAVLFQKVIDYYDPLRKLHIYDSFEGLPDLHQKDHGTRFQKSSLDDASKEDVIANFKEYGLKAPKIHVGWFEETLPNNLPDKICFAHLDGDLYESIFTSLEYVYPKLSKGAICLVDDYCDPHVYEGWNDAPGVKKACDDYLVDKSEKISALYSGEYAHGYFRKL